MSEISLNAELTLWDKIISVCRYEFFVPNEKLTIYTRHRTKVP